MSFVLIASAARDASPSSLSSRILALRRSRKPARKDFLITRHAEAQYASQLRTISKHIGEIVHKMAPGGVIADVTLLTQALNRYADILRPWAHSAAERMLAEANRRNVASWEKYSRDIGRALRKEIQTAPTGDAMRRIMAEQVRKITSLPSDAAERLFHLSAEGMIKGTRASEIAKEIMRSGEVSASRANMVARTAVSSTSTALVRARAEYIGSDGYIWRTSKDFTVRPSHRLMEGKFVRWDNPPTLDGFTGHAGEYANCRCHAQVELRAPLGSRLEA